MRTIARLHKLGIDAFREKTFYLLHLLHKPPEDVGVDHRHAGKGCLRDDEDDRLHRLPGTNVRMVCPLHDEKQRSFSAADRTDPRLETEEFLRTSGAKNRNCKSRSCKSRSWWSQTGSNRRPPACKAGALPTELWPRRPCGPTEAGNQKSEIKASDFRSF